MRWPVFVMALLALCAVVKPSISKEPRTISLSESDVAPIRTALGYTTMLGFDSRPSSVILGDQDAFKVEYVGNGLAIKPLVPRAKTNLFVFTDYDRFNFGLLVGAATEADYAVRVKAKRNQQSVVGTADPVTQASPLIEKRIIRTQVCGGLRLQVQSVAWPQNEGVYLVRFRAAAAPSVLPANGFAFEPGDFDVSQDGRSLPIENLYLERLLFTKQTREIQGTLVLRQAALKRGHPLTLSFTPEFLKNRKCRLSVTFSRQTVSLAKKKG